MDIDVIAVTYIQMVRRLVLAFRPFGFPAGLEQAETYGGAIEDPVVFFEKIELVKYVREGRLYRVVFMKFHVTDILDRPYIGRKRGIYACRKNRDSPYLGRRQLRSVRLERADVRTQVLDVGKPRDVAVVELDVV